MKTYTLNDIRALRLCYDPGRYAPEDWYGTLLDILDAVQVPAEDRIWVVAGLLDDRTNRLFAVWCARQALDLVDNPDPRSIRACDVAEAYANGLATGEELKDASAAAWAAAWVANAAAWDTARAAASAAARDAARDAALDTARDAAWFASVLGWALTGHPRGYLPPLPARRSSAPTPSTARTGGRGK